MCRKATYKHGASHGDSKTGRVVPTQIPSLKPSELVTFLVAEAKHLTKQLLEGRVYFGL